MPSPKIKTICGVLVIAQGLILIAEFQARFLHLYITEWVWFQFPAASANLIL